MVARNLIAVALSVLVFLAAVACAQAPGEVGYTDVPEMPGGIEGERVRLFFDAVNGGDEALMLRLYDECFSERLKERLPRESVAEFLASIVRETGGIDFHSVRFYDPPQADQTVVVYRNRNYGTWQALVFHYAEGEKPDGLLFGLGLSDARTPSDVEPPGSLTEVECIEEIRALVEQGLVSLEDPLSKYADESWFPVEMSQRITIRHLLTHTSGLGSYFNETFQQGSRLRWRELDDYKELIAGDTLAFEPGTDWLYSNTGMFMLGVVIESATGQDYFDYMREHIYGPAGMENTDCYDTDCPVENLAIGYWRPWGPSGCVGDWKNNYYEHVVRGGPAGGGFSTTPDLHRFARALRTGVLVTAQSRELLWTDHFGHDYGYGFSIAEGPAGKVVGHGGGFTGIDANLDIFVDKGYMVAVATNYDEAADPVATKIRELMGRVE